MNPATLSAVSSLVDALKADPVALQRMQTYGNLTEHLIDFLEDHEDDLKQDLK